MKAVKVNGGEDIRDFKGGNVELSQEFDLSARNLRSDVEFSGNRDEIFLQNLH